jgi:hypothetical protein
MFGAMSFGAVNLRVQRAEAIATRDVGTFWNTGEGGFHRKLRQYGGNTIVQVASGRFGVSEDYLKSAAAVEIKIGQGAKPGIGATSRGKGIRGGIGNPDDPPRNRRPFPCADTTTSIPSRTCASLFTPSRRPWNTGFPCP